MKKTCFVCRCVVETGDPVPDGYDNEAAKSSTICPDCLPRMKAESAMIIEQMRVKGLLNKLNEKE